MRNPKRLARGLVGGTAIAPARYQDLSDQRSVFIVLLEAQEGVPNPDREH